MTITYPLDFPTSFGVSGFNYGLDHVVSSAISPFTFEEQVQEHQGVAWDIAFNLDLLNRDQAEAYNSFVLKLKGKLGTFLFSPPGSESPRGAVTGTPLVNGASQTGNTLNIDALPVSTTGVFLAGDFIQLGTGAGSRLYKVLDNADSDGSGQAALTIAPKIVVSPADNSSVVYSSPKGVFRSKDNLVPITVAPPNQFSISVTAREVK